MKKIITVLFLVALVSSASLAADIAVIGHAGLPKLDAVAIRKLYEGRLITAGGTPVTVVNAPEGSGLRNRFLAAYLDEGEEDYTAYWTVRRFIGKGGPPLELPGSAAIIRFVQEHPGAIGYVDGADLKPGLNVLNRR